MEEQIIFGMPQDPEMFLAALSAVQAWNAEMLYQVENALKHLVGVEAQAEQMHKDKKISQGQLILTHQQIDLARKQQEERAHTVTIQLPDHSFDSFLPVFGKSLITYDPWCPVRGAWDLAHRFDPLTAYEIAKPTERHAASAFGLQIGAEASSLPDLTDLGLEHVSCSTKLDVLLVGSWVGQTMIGVFLKNNQPDKTFEFSDETGPDSLMSVHGADMVVGPRCMATYLAAIYGKRVVELYPDDRHRRWLSKWDSKGYRMIYGKQFPEALVWKAMEGLWAQEILVRSHTDHASQIRTGLRTSAAGLAAVSLQELEERSFRQ